jgi:hypothetical protein
VIRFNSGRENENVKHPLELVLEINRLLAPEYAESLIRLHENSYLAS